MYEKLFGLNRRPCLAKVSGNDVFVGPQTAQTMAALRKALQVQDAVVLVAGAPGSGKSTVTSKALNAISGTHRSIRIGRMSLRGSDMLEYLLEELGETELPHGPFRQFALLRKTLAQFESDGTRVVIVVEDAIRLGAESLAELEALTAADAGESGGAALVVMGDARLVQFLPDPQLTRLAQRMQHSVQIRPMTEPEMRGYLLHCIRHAGGEYEKVFTPDAATAIRDLSQGIPRVANKIVEAVLSAAAAGGTRPISASLVSDVARREFGLKPASVPVRGPEPVAATAPEPEARSRAATDPPPVPVPESEPEPEPEPQVDAVAEAAPEPEPEHEPEPEPEPEPQIDAVAEAAPEPETASPTDPEPVIVFSDEPCKDFDDDIPELIQDTLPDLEIRAPEVEGIETADDAEAEPDSDPEPKRELEPEPGRAALSELPEMPELPELQPEPALEVETTPEPANGPDTPRAAPASVESPAREVPEWEQDPTLAELVPDLDALEKALSVAQGEADDGGESPVVEDMPVLQPERAPEAESGEEIPEITLDNAIQERIDHNLIDEPDGVSAGSDGSTDASNSNGSLPDIKLPPRKAKQADAELDRIAAELAKAKTLEDVDDKLAETLFGEEISLAAAEVAARVRARQSANDDELSPLDTDSAEMAQAVGWSVVDGVAEDLRDVEPAVEPAIASGGSDLSASQRIRTVRSMSESEPGASAEPTVAAEHETPSADPATPDPIEDQINISLTQTLKALDVPAPVLDRNASIGDDDDDHDDLAAENDKKRGFFSRFGRS